MTSVGTRDLSLIKRVIVAVVCAPVIVWLFLSRGLPLFIFLAALTLIGQGELFSMFGNRICFAHRITGYIAGVLIITDAFIAHSAFFFAILVVSVIIFFIVEIVSGNENKLENITFPLFATVYPAAFIAFLFKINQFPSLLFSAYMKYLLVFVLLVIWVFDTASYFAGRAFGKHPFFPRISPKKTVEGFVGGLIAASILGIAAGFYIDRILLGHFFFLSVLISLAGQAGDLSESIIKRDMDIKDSSNIIPGHGGVLDRFDSFFFACPAVYGYLVICQWSVVRGPW